MYTSTPHTHTYILTHAHTQAHTHARAHNPTFIHPAVHVARTFSARQRPCASVAFVPGNEYEYARCVLVVVMVITMMASCAGAMV